MLRLKGANGAGKFQGIFKVEQNIDRKNDLVFI